MASSWLSPSVLLAVDLDDPVAGQHAAAIGRRAVQRAEHPQIAVFHGNLNADAAELALHLGDETAQFLGADVAGIRVELADHAADGRLDQLPAIDRFDVVAIHLVNGVDQHLVRFKILVLGVGRWLLGRRGALGRRRRRGTEPKGAQKKRQGPHRDEIASRHELDSLDKKIAHGRRLFRGRRATCPSTAVRYRIFQYNQTKCLRQARSKGGEGQAQGRRAEGGRNRKGHWRSQ